ncbi:hypothetical protein [Flavobacterium sp.]|uniref:hypothetical protein n=1 Tax=Flavobacterium sp. TaxID=239 RepID=UPI002B4B7DE1|nr:hypothetical protein [Flavobacterium sp.]HLF52255.1 hypothetical protein [Flavobacterium sp.]
MTLEQIKSKLKYGDYNTLGQILGITSDAAKMRFNRKDLNAMEAMIKIIQSREDLIREYQPEKFK